MGICVRGVLTNWGDKDFKGMFNREDGSPMTVREIKAVLCDHLAQGHEVIPMGECDNWDLKNGCGGHEVKDEIKDEEVVSVEES